MLSYLIVGSGYRAEYYARISVKFPNLFRALFLCRSEAKAELVKLHTGVNATCSREEAIEFQPDFIVAAVDREHVGSVTKEWALMGFPVLAETPVGSGIEELESIWQLHKEKGAKIVCAEQYHRYPVLAAGLEQIQKGVIGRPISAYLSLAHEYHGFSLICRMLQTCGERYSLRAVSQKHDMLATDSRYGAISDGSLILEERDLAVIDFESGKTAVYDFAAVQYRTFIRSRHLTVRGEKGEWSDRIVSYVDEGKNPCRTFLMPRIPERYQSLDTQGLRDNRKTWTAELFLDTEQDEFAIASMLLDMGEYLAGGAEPYPLKDALEDACFCILLKTAIEHPWTKVQSEILAWNRE